ncbi:post-GPI attachment to proteins factor 2-like [Asterias amurensis]|uniref:post-GPI attachment to proteins factor 2-like n=1 Tax=Asterias amurensis TaxID=7602 RepID=UPI003AB207B0
MHDLNKNPEPRGRPPRILYIPFSVAIIFTLSTMAVGFLLCVTSALMFNRKKSVETHCGVHVPNFLPSISAAIALPPSSYIWKLSIILTSVQRLVAVKFHHMQFSSIRTSAYWYPMLCILCAVAELMENLSLIALTCVTSSEDTALHVKFFGSFQVFSSLFMLLMCVVYKTASGQHPTVWERKSLRFKYAVFAANTVCILIAVFFYYRHTYYCDNYAYTIFSAFEYLVVLTNILYHFIVTYNFSDRGIIFGYNPTPEKRV